MSFRPFVLAVFLTGMMPSVVLAQSAESAPEQLFLELNSVQDVGGACRLTFSTRNETGVTIEKAVFETVIFDTSGGVVSLSLFDFRDLPADRPRVRQFELPATACDSVGRVLINGSNSCLVDGVNSTLCSDALSLSSRIEIELIG